MEFLTERCYSALNAEELKIGSKCIFANNLDSLKCKVEEGTDIRPIVQILNDAYERRFKTDVSGEYPFAYLVSVPEVKDWIVYLCRGPSNPEDYYLTACRSDRWEVVQKDYDAKTKLFEGTDEECDRWYVPRRHFADVIAAWEDGKTIQFNSGYGWEDCCDNKPAWDINSQYRIKPEEKKLKWTDLKIGDIIKNESGTQYYMVVGIDMRGESKTHIYNGVTWLDNDDLEYWEKVE